MHLPIMMTDGMRSKHATIEAIIQTAEIDKSGVPKQQDFNYHRRAIISFILHYAHAQQSAQHSCEGSCGDALTR